MLRSTTKSSEGSLEELSALCLDLLDLLDSPRISPLLLFDSMLPLRPLKGNFVMATLLLFSPLAFPSLALVLLAFAFLDLLSFCLLSDGFACFCDFLLG